MSDENPIPNGDESDNKYSFSSLIDKLSLWFKQGKEGFSAWVEKNRDGTITWWVNFKKKW